MAEETAGGVPEIQEFAVGTFDAKASTALSPSNSETYIINLEIRDITYNTLVTNAHLELFLRNRESLEEFNTLRYVDDSGSMGIQLDSGTWTLVVKLDELSSSGKDYYSELELDVFENNTITIYIQPVGSLFGYVLDSKGALVTGAEIIFECSAAYGETDSETSNDYGSFNKPWLPVGSCRVSAKKNGMAGSTLLTIEKGKLIEADVTLSEEVSSDTVFELWWFFLAGIIIFALLVLATRRRSAPFARESKSKGILKTVRMDDILSALDAPEKEIMGIILREGGESIQSKIQRELSMPKSTLSRYVASLESRGLIKTEKLGRIKKIELSESFLNRK
jgi:DNA-binding transcriptional ArsR family regulator